MTEPAFWDLRQALSYIADRNDRTGAFYERCRNSRPPIGERFWLGVGVEAPPGAIATGDGFAVFRAGAVQSVELAKAAHELVRLCATGAVSATGRAGAEAPRLLIAALRWLDLAIRDFDGSGPQLYDYHAMPLGPSSNPQPALLDVLFPVDELERALLAPEPKVAPPAAVETAEPVTFYSYRALVAFCRHSKPRPKNWAQMDAAAAKHFGRAIPDADKRQAHKEVGPIGTRGRPKTRPK
jgi:hypothetical protein